MLHPRAYLYPTSITATQSHLWCSIAISFSTGQFLLDGTCFPERPTNSRVQLLNSLTFADHLRAHINCFTEVDDAGADCGVNTCAVRSNP